jgi:hypothetical protein
MKSTGENRQLGKNLSQCHFVHHKSHMDLDLGSNPGLRGERPATNRLSHGTALCDVTPKRFGSLIKFCTLYFNIVYKLVLIHIIISTYTVWTFLNLLQLLSFLNITTKV